MNNNSCIKNVGSTIVFGSYYQTDSTKKEPIEWQILAVEGNKSLIISKKILDCKKYNESYESVTWESCSIRKWLNNEFKNLAFSESEQQRIQTTCVTNKNNPTYNTNGGSNTTDKIFLLSIEDACKYFSTDDERACMATEYAKEKGIHVDSFSGNSQWWLCSPGNDQDFASYVFVDGFIEAHGHIVTSNNNGVRPALWISNI